jgi:CHAT domain-containing protein
VATHAIRYPVYGGEPALLLSSPAAGAEGERIGASLLTESEIADMKLSAAKLAFISSCESAIGHEAGGKHEFGIGGAFLEAGVHAVVATVWPIEDAAAKEFATAFYDELLQDGGSPAEALRRAETRFIAEDRAAGNPLRRVNVWSPFIVLGSFENR